MTKAYAYLIILLLWTVNSTAQSSRLVNDSIITNLVTLTEKGNKRGLRDLGTFLNHDKLKTKVQNVLKRLTFFHDNNIYESKEKFLNYYYQNEKTIKYDALNSVFHNSKVQNINLNYAFQPLQQKTVKEQNINHLSPSQLDTYINQITDPNINFPTQKLFEIYLNERNSSKLSPKNLNKIIERLSTKPNVGFLSTLINISKKDPELGSIPRLIERISLFPTKGYKTTNEYISAINNLVDTLGSINDIRLEYYKTITDIKPNYYYDPVDFLGHILLFSKSEALFDNILVDLKMTHNPRALFYIASFFYLHKDNPKLYKKAQQNLERLTAKRLGVPNAQNQITYDNFDIDAFKNYLSYWSENTENYIWDDELQQFIHKNEIKKKSESYDNTIRLLYSKNDSIARLAFIRLSQGEPEKVNELIHKIKPKQKKLNHVVPSLKYQYLEQLTLLNKYCRINGLETPVTFKSKLLLNRLENKTTMSEQYNIENQIVKQFSFGEITELERQAIIYANNKSFNISISRILDRLYSKYWKSIVRETSKLSFYLKKSAIFSKIGVSGTSQAYLNKFSKQNVESKTLLQLYHFTQDADVKNQIQKLFVKFKVFIDTKSKNSTQINEDIKKLMSKRISKLSKRQIQIIFKTIEDAQNNKEILDFLFKYLETNASLKIAKNCLKLASRKDINKDTKLRLTRLLNIIYDDQQNIDFWVQLWEKDRKEYKVWGQKLLNAKIKLIREKEKLTPKLINQVLQSTYFSFDDKKICLENIHKVRPKKIKYLKFTHLLPNEDLQYFEKIKIPIKDLDNIVLFFDAKTRKQQKLLLTFLISKTKDSDVSKKAKLINSLFRQPFFIEAIENQVLPEKYINEIKSILKDNLENATYISEYDEELTISNIAKLDLIDKNIIEQIKASIKLDAPENIKAKLQFEILSRIDLNDVVYALPYFHLLSVSSNYNPKSFLYNDFGIPIFSPYPAKQLDELANLLETGDRFEMYYHFLKLNQIDFTESRGNLDFDKIYELLKFGAATTFCSSSGGIDDYFTYGIIKLLEFHFRTRLGFHKKLNENQTFYVFTTFPRAEKWMKFLEDKKLVKSSPYKNYSFNHVSK